MYTEFYNLHHKPFETNPDPSFLWLDESHEKVLSTLRYALFENKGLLLLTGDAGSGKTTLVGALTEHLESDISWAVIDDPALERVDFYNAIARAFDIEGMFTSKVQFLIQFSRFLHSEAGQKRKVLLLIDDCHRLRQEMLEELRLLSNMEIGDAKLINIFFVGQPEFYEMLMRPANRALLQRLTLNVELHPLDINGTGAYIRHRLKAAGSEESLFNARAIEVIHRLSRGIPDRINAICQLALVNGSARGLSVIDQTIIAASARDLNLAEDVTTKNFDTYTDYKQRIFKKFKEKFIAKIAQYSHWFLNLIPAGKDRRKGLKYGLGLLVILLAGLFLGFQLSHPPENQPAGNQPAPPVEIAKEPVPENVPQVSSLPEPKSQEENKNAVMEERQEPESPQAALATEESAQSASQPAAPGAESEELAEAPGAVKIEEPHSKEGVGPTAGLVHIVPEKSKVLKITPLKPSKLILQFRSDSNDLTGTSQGELDDFIHELRKYPRARILIRGLVSKEADTEGSVKLSEELARGVRRILLAEGIGIDQVKVARLGNQEPAGPDETGAGLKKKRLVEIIVLKDGI